MLKTCPQGPISSVRFIGRFDSKRNNNTAVASINLDGSTDFTSFLAVCHTIGPRLRKGDLIMLRSTVPVGTTRNTVIPILENCSDLVAGVDFHVAFSPERTVEGVAMSELSTLSAGCRWS